MNKRLIHPFSGSVSSHSARVDMLTPRCLPVGSMTIMPAIGMLRLNLILAGVFHHGDLNQSAQVQHPSILGRTPSPFNA